MLEFFKSDLFLIIVLIINIILLFSVIVSNIKINKMSKSTKEFMRKLGNGKDIREDLEKYMDRIIDLESGISETNTHCKLIDNKLKQCVQKVGIVRFNAYRDAGSNLSFAVALLDEKNDGVVFNGLYSREASNIYAKPIVNGKSSYSMTAEEETAVMKAMKNDGIQRMS